MDVPARTLLFIALSGLVGLASAQILLRSRDADTADATVSTRSRMGVLLSLTGVVAALLLGWSQLAAFRDPFVPWQEDATILLGTPWGRRWGLLLAGFTLSTAAFAVRRARVLGWALAPVLALYPSFSGHAAAVEGLAPLTMTLDWIHVLASGAWIGALGVLAWAGRPGSPGPAPLVRVLPAFSLQARVAVGLVVLTGAAATAVHVGDVTALATSRYGRILAAKVGLVGLLLLTGLYNWRVLSRDAGSPDGGARLVRSARVEVGLGLLVLALAAWVAGTPPPG